MFLDLVKKQNFDAGWNFAFGEFEAQARCWAVWNEDALLSMEEIAYQFANKAKGNTWAVYIPEERLRDADFVDGVENFGQRISEMIKRERVIKGDILAVEVKW